MGIVAHVTAEEFDSEVLQSTVPVLVDFMADWCGPCRAIGPELEAVAVALEGKAKILKLNVDEHPDVESRYGVRTIPTLIVFKAGRVVDTINGAVPRREITRTLEPHL